MTETDTTGDSTISSMDTTGGLRSSYTNSMDTTGQIKCCYLMDTRGSTKIFCSTNNEKNNLDSVQSVSTRGGLKLFSSIGEAWRLRNKLVYFDSPERVS